MRCGAVSFWAGGYGLEGGEGCGYGLEGWEGCWLRVGYGLWALGYEQGRMRGSLHCATDDTAVRRSGRDDGFGLRGLRDDGFGLRGLGGLLVSGEADPSAALRDDNKGALRDDNKEGLG